MINYINNRIIYHYYILKIKSDMNPFHYYIIYKLIIEVGEWGGGNMVQEVKWEAEILRKKATGLLYIPFQERPDSPFL